jgi:hypothetical protein
MGFEPARSVVFLKPIAQAKSAVFQGVPKNPNLAVLICHFITFLRPFLEDCLEIKKEPQILVGLLDESLDAART